MLSLLIALAGLAPLASPRPAPPEDFRWHGAIAPGKTLEVRGINGGVHAIGTGGSEAEVVARKRGRRSDPASVEIRVVQREGGVVICAVYPNRQYDGCEPGRHERHDDDNDVNVDFTVKVPKGVHFVGGTVNGGIEATGLDADAEVSTVNGDATVETRGNAEATTVNGTVTATMGRADWTGKRSLTTVNGDVIVDLPANPSLEVHASTLNGGLESDYPLLLKGKFGPRRLTGTIGSGGRSLDVTTVNGSIRLRRAS
jgi:DUF4097 and DUF4098 domain-containing protein YvlB